MIAVIINTDVWTCLWCEIFIDDAKSLNTKLTFVRTSQAKIYWKPDSRAIKSSGTLVWLCKCLV